MNQDEERSFAKQPGELIQKAARMLANIHAFGYQKGTAMPINRHIREWLTEYEKATGDTAHKVLAAVDGPGEPK
jgi:hypothetical protein